MGPQNPISSKQRRVRTQKVAVLFKVAVLLFLPSHPQLQLGQRAGRVGFDPELRRDCGRNLRRGVCDVVRLLHHT